MYEIRCLYTLFYAEAEINGGIKRYRLALVWHSSAKNTNQIYALWLAKIDRPLLRASALDLNPQACSDFSSLVGDPSAFRSAPFIDPMRTPKDPRRLLLPLLTGALRLDPGFSRS